MKGGLALELRVETPGGGRRRHRLGPWGSALAAAALLAALVSLGLGIAALPSQLANSRLQREMNLALERRTQLGTRLRALVEAYGELDRQTREHAARVDRIRRLYGLPEMVAARTETAGAGAPDSIFGGAILAGRRLDAVVEATLVRTDALLASLARWETEHREEVHAVPALLPVRAADSVLVAGFGARREPVTGEPEQHAGIDLAAPGGATVRAPSEGVVRWAGEPPPAAGELWWRLGRTVVIAHGSAYRTLYGHCDRILVRVGQRVAAGTPIATVGRSGWTPTPRLHYEVRRRDAEGEWRPLDPLAMVLDPAFAPGAAPAAERRPGDPLPPPLPSAYRR